MSNEIKFSQDYVSFMPKKQKVYPISEHDWNKLKSIIKRCSPSRKRPLKDIALLLYGGGISALLALIALYNSDKVATWVLNINWIILVCAFLIGIACNLLSKEQNKVLISDIELAVQEMESIEQKYDEPRSELQL